MNKFLKSITLFLTAFIMAFSFAACGESKEKIKVSLFAAASMEAALSDVIELFYESNDSYEITTNYGSSGTLAEQIKTAGGADIFIAASQKSLINISDYMDIESKYDIVENKLVVISGKNVTVPAFDTAKTQQENAEIFMSYVTDNSVMVSIGEYEGSSPVPAGDYAYKLLSSYSSTFFTDNSSKISRAANVTAVLNQVSTGAADFGFVYATDAALFTDKVSVLYQLIPLTNIIYPAAFTQEGKDKEGAKVFFEFLKTDAVKEILANYGFTVL
jgi:molybdate transport system substrate-binding protein